MLATVNASLLTTALRNGVASPKSTLPILGHALLESDAAGLRVTTTDTAVRTQSVVAATFEAPGRFCADAARLRDALIGGGDIALKLQEDALMVLRGARSRMKVGTLPAQDWPVPEDLQFDPIDMDPLAAAAAIDATTYPTIRNDPRGWVSAVHFFPDYVVACDGVRSAMADLKHAGPLFSVPVTSLPFLRKRLNEGAVVSLAQRNKVPVAMAVQDGLERVEVALLSNTTVPNFLSLYPTTPPLAWATVDTAELRAAVARLAPFCERRIGSTAQINYGARFALENGALRVEAVGGESFECLAGTAGEGSVDWGLNMQFLAQALDACPADTIRLDVPKAVRSDSVNLLLSAEGMAGRHLIMSMVL